MIDLNHIILNSSFQVESLADTNETSSTEDLTKLNVDQDDKDIIIDPSSFVLLLSQLLVNMPVNTDIPSDTNVTTEDIPSFPKNTATQVINLKNNKQLQFVDNSGSELVQLNQQTTPSVENNIALTWINSEHFQPPQSFSIDVIENEKFIIQIQSLSPEQPELLSEINKSETQIKGINSVENSPQVTVLSNYENQNYITVSEKKSIDIQLDISNSKWADQFSEQIIWMGHQGIKSALIKIHPEDLGPLEISVKVVKDSTSVTIISHSSHVRDIVDQALPRLREMMANQGLNLSEVHIGSDSSAQQFNQQDNKANEDLIQNIEDEVQLPIINKRANKGLIDYFA